MHEETKLPTFIPRGQHQSRATQGLTQSEGINRAAYVMHHINDRLDLLIGCQGLPVGPVTADAVYVHVEGLIPVVVIQPQKLR